MHWRAFSEPDEWMNNHHRPALQRRREQHKTDRHVEVSLLPYSPILISR